ncbi:glutathione binding-like protein [Roseospira visakhapatnamensis]|uniref:GST-like protein n=1 Tax=Roseospira visakhapatnamensis TaxID=390880 RepID=A0A7W6RB72_9PROT|nr:glutathione binding-like protein [Roseospira visakhapatnamensis]MBB4264931.1 GST-like protein [Roseospira visakhapatnamensis]
MIDLFFWPTPNGFKVTLMLEELGVPYRVHAINITKNDQFHPDFLAIAPNNRMPAIIDSQPADGGPPLSVFESGAILIYLAETHGRFLPTAPRTRLATLEWLFWQMGGLGPMAGQAHHFRHYAPDPIPYAVERYTKEVTRLYGVMDRRLDQRPFLVGEDYTIADMASWPWVASHERQGQALDSHPNLKRWFEAIAARPATRAGRAVGQDWTADGTVTSDESLRVLAAHRTA